MNREITLYKHQKKIVKKVKKQFKKSKRHILVQSATGSGKTIMFSFIASQAASKNKKVLIITDRVELLSQAGGTIEEFNMNPYYIQAGTKFIDKTKTVYIGMSQTLRNRITIPVWKNFIQNNIDLIIIDEAHIQEFNHFFENDFLKNKFVIGFTATPVRNGKMTQLGLQYETIISGESVKRLIKKGYLLNCDIYDCGAPDLSGVTINKSKGDYSESSMFNKYDNAKLYKGLVKNYQRIVSGQKMIVFCCNVEHAIKTTKQLNKAGINAKFISSKKIAPKEPRKWTKANEVIFKEKFKSYKLYEKYFNKFSGERSEIFDWFKKTKDAVLVNVDIATKGFDEPTICVVALYRATTSLALYLQMLGRGGRTSPGKTHFTVLDFGGNKARFGGYDVDRDWSLWHEENKTEGGIPPMKICGEDAKFNEIKGGGEVKIGCKRLVLASYKICPFCGFKNPEKDKVKEAELALAELVDEKGVSLKVKAFKDMTFEELTKYREIKKHHINWLYRMLWVRQGEKTIKEYAKQYNWSNRRIYQVLAECNEKY
jgi:superfamily II DNA or RNA helicase